MRQREHLLSRRPQPPRFRHPHWADGQHRADRGVIRALISSENLQYRFIFIHHTLGLTCYFCSSIKNSDYDRQNLYIQTLALPRHQRVHRTVGGYFVAVAAGGALPRHRAAAIYVWASYPGASAETVHKSMVMPLEEAINGVEGMTYMTSSASNGSASITIYFEQGANADMAAVNVQNRVIQAQVETCHGASLQPPPVKPRRMP